MEKYSISKNIGRYSHKFSLVTYSGEFIFFGQRLGTSLPPPFRPVSRIWINTSDEKQECGGGIGSSTTSREMALTFFYDDSGEVAWHTLRGRVEEPTETF